MCRVMPFRPCYPRVRPLLDPDCVALVWAAAAPVNRRAAPRIQHAYAAQPEDRPPSATHLVSHPSRYPCGHARDNAPWRTKRASRESNRLYRRLGAVLGVCISRWFMIQIIQFCVYEFSLQLSKFSNSCHHQMLILMRGQGGIGEFLPLGRGLGSGLVKRNMLQSSESFVSSWFSRRVDDVPGHGCSQDHRCR